MKPGTTKRPVASIVSEPSYGPDPGDRPVDDRDVRVEPLPGEHREDTAPTDDQVGRLVSARDGEAALQGLHRADDNGSLRTGGLGYNAGMAGAACTHLDTAQVTELPDPVTGCEECLKIGSQWVHLRMCLACGKVGCCDNSPHRHATAHFHETGHPLIRSAQPGESWWWCYVDEVMLAPAA